MKIALVHDDFIQWGGAERLFKTYCEIWPKAPIFTSIFINNPRFKGIKRDNITTSFMQQLPLKKLLYRHYFFLYPLAFEGFVFDDFDVVLSSSTRFAHGIITKPKTLHIAYLNSPPRMFWEPHDYFENSLLKTLSLPLLNYLRLWDTVAAARADFIITNSKASQKRIKKYYDRESEIIYPFVELSRFEKIPPNSDGDYFLIVSRLNRWKKIDIAIQSCNELNLPLIVIGSGPDLKRLKSLAGPTVQFLGSLTEEEVVRYYIGCKALIFPQEEDFGITPLECLAAGKPVIAYKAGGALETIIEGKVGEFFYPQESKALSEVLLNFNPKKFSPVDCVAQVRRFEKANFKQAVKKFVEEKYKCFTTIQKD